MLGSPGLVREKKLLEIFLTYPKNKERSIFRKEKTMINETGVIDVFTSQNYGIYPKKVWNFANKAIDDKRKDKNDIESERLS